MICREKEEKGPDDMKLRGPRRAKDQKNVNREKEGFKITGKTVRRGGVLHRAVKKW